jgi:hypothetical protein
MPDANLKYISVCSGIEAWRVFPDGQFLCIACKAATERRAR